MFPEEGTFKKAHFMFLKFLLSIYFLIYAYVAVNRERSQKFLDSGFITIAILVLIKDFCIFVLILPG